MKKRGLNTILTLIALIGLLSFISKKEDERLTVFIKGKIINLKTNEPLKRFPISITVKMQAAEEMAINYYSFDTFYPHPGKTNGNGEFGIETLFNKEYLDFWLFNPALSETNLFSGIQFSLPIFDEAKSIDTIDLGDVYLVPYDNEFERISSHPTKTKRKKKEKFEKFKISEIDSLFKHSNNAYNMQMEPIDTVVWSTERYNAKAGEYIHTTEKYKTVNFRRMLK